MNCFVFDFEKGENCVYLHVSNVHSTRVYFTGLPCAPLILGLLAAGVLILLVSLGVE